jgi:CubicO group peptidase (beta-lactamase class C family)
MRSKFTFLAIFLLSLSCNKKEDPTPTSLTLYFPSNGAMWETITPASLGWNEAAIPDLKSFLSTANSRAFIVLKDGKIVMEEYMGIEINSSAAFTSSSNWYWASAGKTLTSALVGIAESQGKINFDAKTSDYLGVGWTNLTAAQENKVTVRNQLTMTSGLDDLASDNNCTDKTCLVYKADAGTRWAYHTGVYTLLDGVIAAGTGQSLNTYLNTQLRDKIGMDGTYIKSGYNNLYYSTPRSMARFGLLLLSKGVWNGTTIIPESYFNLMITTSQNINQSYGYLTWLNGKSSYLLPGLQTVFQGLTTPNAPTDMFAAMGKNGQLVNVIPSKNIVVIRMGDAPDNSLVPIKFQNDLWEKLNAVIVK